VAGVSILEANVSKKSRSEMTAEELEALRKEQRERKQRSREKIRAERERQKQIATEQNDPVKRWERNRAERPDAYQDALDRAEMNAFNERKMREAIVNIRAGNAPFEENDITLLDLCEDVLNSIDTFAFDDHLYCPTEWLDEFQMAYESSLVTGKNREYYEFGVGQCRISRDLWLEFVEVAGASIKTIPDYASNDVAARMVGSMKQPTQPYDQGAMRECPSCRVLANSVWISDAIWNEYEKGIPYRCHKCRDAERKSRTEVASAVLGSTAGAVYDKFGRVKDNT
jgi:hypothetical protein